MSGWPRWASDAPSHSCTSPWMIDCGCTTTSMRSYGVPNRWWASITSRPLFISVAESIVILPPIAQVGCWSASSTLTSSSSARERPRNGPPEAVMTSLSTAPGGLAGDQLVQRGVLGVDRDQLGAGGLGQRHHEVAADDERLLVGERDVDALGQRHDRRAEPGRADDRVEHEVGAGLRHEPHEALGAGQHLALGPRLGGARRGVAVAERDPGHAVLPGELDEPLVGALGGQPDELELLAARDSRRRAPGGRSSRWHRGSAGVSSCAP